MGAGVTGRIKAIFSFLLILFISTGIGCRRQVEELPVIPVTTHPLVREFVGYGVINVSFTHLLEEPNSTGASQGYLRRGTVVRIIERRQVIIRGNPELWVLAEGNYDGAAGSGASVQGWLQDTTVDIFDNESRAKTASRTMSQ